jgi:hypothetical protein
MLLLLNPKSTFHKISHLRYSRSLGARLNLVISLNE